MVGTVSFLVWNKEPMGIFAHRQPSRNSPVLPSRNTKAFSAMDREELLM